MVTGWWILTLALDFQFCYLDVKVFRGGIDGYAVCYTVCAGAWQMYTIIDVVVSSWILVTTELIYYTVYVVMKY